MITFILFVTQNVLCVLKIAGIGAFTWTQALTPVWIWLAWTAVKLWFKACIGK